MFFTIFTPTYNRGSLLERLYKSLKNQTYKNFEWLIIDDGSNDDTENIVKNFINEKKIEIIYIKKENEGKQKTYNLGIKKARGDYFICIDSDDYYIINGLEIIKKYIDKHKKDKNISAYSYLSMDENGNLIGTRFPKNEIKSKPFDIYYNYNVRGDKGIALKTKILKNYEFPLIDKEKFITEAVLYNRIAKNSYWIFINEIIEIKEYQVGGLSNNILEIMKKNPKGYDLYYKELQENINSVHSFIKVNYSYYIYYVEILRKFEINKLKYKVALFLYPLFYLKNRMRRKK